MRKKKKRTLVQDSLSAIDSVLLGHGVDLLPQLAVQPLDLPVVLVALPLGAAELAAQGLAHCNFLSVEFSHYIPCKICGQK